jgi:UDP-glucose 4-epimerase
MKLAGCASQTPYSWRLRHHKLKIFITGGRGRLANSLRPLLAQQGHHIQTFSRNANAQHLPLSGLGRELERNPADIVLHLAWSTVPATAELEPGIEWREDLPLLSQIVTQLLRQKKAKGRSPLLIFFSSCSIYGNGRITRPFLETDPGKPIGWYARGKLEAERLLSYYHAVHGLPLLILRVSNPYGFSQDAKVLQGVIPTLLRSVLSQKPFRQWGDGKAVKDFLHIEDLFSVLQRCLTQKTQGIFNVCSGQPVSLRMLIRKIEKDLGMRLTVRREKAKSWDVTHAAYSPLRIRKITGWSPRINLEEGLKICREAVIAARENVV